MKTEKAPLGAVGSFQQSYGQAGLRVRLCKLLPYPMKEFHVRGKVETAR